MIQHSHLLFLSLTAVLVFGCSTEKPASEYLASALAHQQAGEISAALIQTRNAVAQEPENADARSLLGELELLDSDPVAAESSLKRAMELGNHDTGVIRSLAHAYLLQGKTDELLDIDISPLSNRDLADVLAFKTEAALAIGELKAATRFAAESLIADPLSAPALTVNAKLQIAKNNIPEARTYLAKTTDNSPDYSPAWELSGDIDASEQRFAEAVDMYSSAIGTSSRQLSPLFKRARAHLALSDLEAASDDIRALDSAQVNSPGVKQIRAEIQLRQGEFTNAQISLEQALTDAPDYLPAVRTLAITHMLLGNIGQAEQYGRQYLNSEQTDDARVLLATIRLQATQYKQAENTLQPLRNAGRLNLSGSQLLATIFLKQNKLDDAINTMLELKSNLERAGRADVVDLAMLSSPVNIMTNQLLGNKTSPGEGEGEDEASYFSERELQVINAVEALVSGQTGAALAIANSLLDKENENSSLHTLVGRIYASTGETEKAAQSLSTAMQVAEEPGIETIIASMNEVNAGNPEKARSILENTLDKTGGLMRERVLLALASISGMQNDPKTMLRWLKQANTESPSSYRTSLALATYYFRSEKHELVLSTLSQLDDISKKNPNVLELQAETHMALGDFDKAIEVISPMVQLEPQNPNWIFLRAKANAGENNMDEVDRDIGKALLIDPKHAPSLIAKTNLDILKQDFSTVGSQLTSLREIMPDSELVDQLQKRIASSPRHTAQSDTSQTSNESLTTTEDVINSARALWASDQKDAAIETMKIWLENSPEDITVGLALANSYNAYDRPDDAVRAFEQVIHRDPDNFIALNNLAWSLRNNDPDTALVHVRRAVSLQPDNVNSLDTLAVILMQEKKLEMAEETFAKIQALNTEDPSILYHGAMILSANGKTDDALNILEPLIDDNILFPEALAARSLYGKLRNEP